jgi:hypothetical protein
MLGLKESSAVTFPDTMLFECVNSMAIRISEVQTLH